MELTHKERVVLAALLVEPLTVDEFVTERGWYVNSWAPTFTRLRKRGLVKRTGSMRRTSHGALAYVIGLTDAGTSALTREMVAA